ncbi:MAG: hypothetical protein WC595_01390 [Candidatus Nanoarchaeia archaeon]
MKLTQHEATILKTVLRKELDQLQKEEATIHSAEDIAHDIYLYANTREYEESLHHLLKKIHS